MLELALIIVIVWALLRFVPVSPLRENSAVHVVLVLGVCILIYWALTGDGPRVTGDGPRVHHLFRR